MERIKKISLHKPITPYTYELDNNPLKDLAKNDVRLQKQVDALLVRLFNTVKTEFTRNHFKALRPSIVESRPSYLNIAPGSFLCRMPTRSGPWSSDRPIGSGINTRAGGLEVERSKADTLHLQDFHKYGETNRTSVIFYKGGSVTFEPWDDNDFNWKIVYGDATPDPPTARIDLVCVQGFPSEDQTGTNPTILGTDGGGPNLVVIKGAGWRNFPVLTSAGEYDQMHPFDGLWRGEDPNINAAAGIGGQYHYGVGTSIHPSHGASRYWDGSMSPSPGLMRAKTYAISRSGLDLLNSELEIGTIPAPDDIINSAYHVTPSHPELFTSIVEGLDTQSWKATVNTDEVGLFCVPIAYVRIPKGYAGGPILSKNVKDIRPLLRSAELTLSEREGLSNMYKPEAGNRALTIFDSDYTALVDFILREDQWNRYELQHMWNNSETPQRQLTPGNHEGRLRAMEDAVQRPQVQVAPNSSFRSTPIPFSNGVTSDTYYQEVAGGENFREYFGAGPKTMPSYRQYDPGLYYQVGQYIPCVRNYLNRFVNETYDPREKWARNDAGAGHPYEDPFRVFGATEVQTRRQVIRGKYLSYSSEFHNPSLPYQAHRIEKGGHYGGLGDKPRRLLYPGYGANVTQKFPTWDRYKIQTVEISFIWPTFDPDRDEELVCKEVWRQGEKGRGWSGFGHGGDYDDAGWVTECSLEGGDLYAQTEVGFGIPNGMVPYWVDVDALGFAPGSIDCLQIINLEMGDFIGHQGQHVSFRFNESPPKYAYDDGETIPAMPYDSAWGTLDQRQRYITKAGSWSDTGIKGEKIEYGDGRTVNQISYGYSGFCMMVHCGTKRVGGGLSFFYGFNDNPAITVSDWEKKSAKLIITGPAHAFYNGAFLPVANNSDCGDRGNGETWID